MAANSRFLTAPKQYLEEKLLSAVFKKVWTTVVARNITKLVDAALEMEPPKPQRSSSSRHYGGFASIDENSISLEDGIFSSYHDAGAFSEFGDQLFIPYRDPLFHIMQKPNSRSPPLSDLNPVSLPDLGCTRPSIASAPPIHHRKALLQSDILSKGPSKLLNRTQKFSKNHKVLRTLPNKPNKPMESSLRKNNSISVEGKKYYRYNESKRGCRLYTIYINHSFSIFRQRSSSGSPPSMSAKHKFNPVISKSPSSDLSLPPIVLRSSPGSPNFPSLTSISSGFSSVEIPDSGRSFKSPLSSARSSHQYSIRDSGRSSFRDFSSGSTRESQISSAKVS